MSLSPIPPPQRPYKAHAPSQWKSHLHAECMARIREQRASVVQQMRGKGKQETQGMLREIIRKEFLRVCPPSNTQSSTSTSTSTSTSPLTSSPSSPVAQLFPSSQSTITSTSSSFPFASASLSYPSTSTTTSSSTSSSSHTTLSLQPIASTDVDMSDSSETSDTPPQTQEYADDVLTHEEYEQLIHEMESFVDETVDEYQQEMDAWVEQQDDEKHQTCICPTCKRNYLHLTTHPTITFHCICGFRLPLSHTTSCTSLSHARHLLESVYTSHKSYCDGEPTFDVMSLEYGAHALFLLCSQCDAITECIS